jgi:hypothetical protein
VFSILTCRLEQKPRNEEKVDITNNAKDNKEVTDENGESSKDSMYNIRISKIVNE